MTGAVVPGGVVLGAVDLTALFLLAEEVAPEDAGREDPVPEEAGLVIGLGRAAGRGEAITGDSLVAPVEAGWAGVVGAIGPVLHGLSVIAKALSAAALPPELEVGAVPVGVVPADSVGVGVVGARVGAGVGVIAGVAVGPAGTTLERGGLGFRRGLDTLSHVDVGDGLAVGFAPFPIPLEGRPAPPGSGWAVPLLLAPPVPPPDPVPPDEDEEMFPIALRKLGIAAAVPANRQTAARAMASRSPVGPSRCRVARSPVPAPAMTCRRVTGPPRAPGASWAAVTWAAGVARSRPDGTCQTRRARLKSHARASAATYRSR